MTQDQIKLNGKTFVPTEQLPIPEPPCVLNEELQPTLAIKDDNMFLVTDNLGNVSGCLRDDLNTSIGLFCYDTRFLSRLNLQIQGRLPILLISTANKAYSLEVLSTNPRIDNHLKPNTIGIQRKIVLNGALFEEIELSNYSTTNVSFALSISFDADFVDLFELRGLRREKRGQRLRAIREGQPTEQKTEELTLAYQGLDGCIMESRIHFQHRLPDFFKGYTAIWQLKLESHETVKLVYQLQMFINNQPLSKMHAPVTLAQAKAVKLLDEQNWMQQTTRIRSGKAIFNQVLERAEEDIYLLQQSFGNNKALSAGIPWFSTLFGRNAIIAASQTLMLNPMIARETLTILAKYQGQKYDDWRDEQPGKILHEIRFGEMARCGEIPHTPYYGSVDATPLWLMLYADYYAWTADVETLEALWPNALAAMDWIDHNSLETGYLRYECRSKQGLVNQGWKDSGNCIIDSKGQLAIGPIALCEVQAYVYAAKLRLSQIARSKNLINLAEQWEDEARNLKVRFNRDFWMEDQDYCALALDGKGEQVDSITSNPGLCLNFDIFSPEKASSVAERLRAPDMFNGWGIRTLSSLSLAYNPMGYHVGAVWPQDNSLIAMGLRSLGFIDQALELFEGLIDMTQHQPYKRSPKFFCGYERTVDNTLAQYPVACLPQAWAAGSLFQLLQTVVNLVPDAPNNCLRIIYPTLPESLNRLSLRNLRVGGTQLDLEFERSSNVTACRVAKKRGNLRIMIET